MDDSTQNDKSSESSSENNIVMNFLVELFTNPINVVLLLICCFLLYKILAPKRNKTPEIPREPRLPKLKKRDWTIEEIKKYNGSGPEGRILMAVNGKVFDVTRGKRFYGPEGPYGVFAGRDASRGLATFSLTEDVLKDEYDDLSDLNSMEMESVREWDMQFTEKYDYVGKLLKPGEAPTEYSETEDEQNLHEKSKND